MAKGRLFRAANIYLVMAGVLSAALLFAPLAYASNFSGKVHASIYGMWVVLDKDLGSGVDFITHTYLPQLPLHYPYALAGAVLSIFLIFMAFDNGNEERKLKRVMYMFFLCLGQILFVVLIRLFALHYVGNSEIDTNLEAGFQREFALHFFVLYFIWRCIRRLRAERHATQKQDFQGFA